MKLPLRSYARVGAIALAFGATVALAGCGGGGNSGSSTGYVSPSGVPSIVSFTSTGDTSGSTVTITGTNFAAGDTVDFGSVPATTAVVNTPTKITATVPAGSSTVQIKVSGASGSSAATNNDLFSYNDAPAILTITPTTAGGGTTLTIAGRNFVGTPTVTFGTAATPVTAVAATATSTSLTVVVPAGLAAGPIPVTVTNTTGTTGASNSVDFTVGQAPTISSISPTSGSAGTVITVTGTNFDSSATVTIGGATAAVTYNSATSLTVTAPAGTAGPQNLVVTTTTGGSSTPASFTYAPIISSISPNSGSNETTITVTGTDFDATSSATIGGTTATVVYNSPTSLTITAPAGILGAQNLVVSTTTGGPSAPATFTYAAPTLTSAASADGLTVTLTGTNFTPDSTAETGGVTEPINYISPTSATATFPPATFGSGTAINVYNDNGESNTGNIITP